MIDATETPGIWRCRACGYSNRLPSREPIAHDCTVAAPPCAAPANFPCTHRGDVVRRTPCESCGGKVKIKVFACDLHGECALSAKAADIRQCRACVDRRPSPEPPAREISRLAVVACHYNPAGFETPRSNYLRFASGLAAAGVPLWTVELAYGDEPFWVPAQPGVEVIRLRGDRARNLMWQKEALLNVAIRRVPPEFDAIGWFDADVLFENPAWPAAVCDALGRYAVIQPMDEIYTFYPDGRKKFYRRSAAAAHVRATRDSKAHPGFAWAARADWLRRHLLLCECIAGAGDTIMAAAFARRKSAYYGQWATSAWAGAGEAWSAAVRDEIAGAFGYCPGRLLHLYHGSHANRRYDERWRWQKDHGFDPTRDVELEPSGLLAWSDFARETKPELIAKVAAYFDHRKEDEWPPRT